MSIKKTFLVRVIDAIFGQRKRNEHLKKRALSVEPLEVRELLSVGPLLPWMFDNTYVVESSSSFATNLWTVDVETLEPTGQTEIIDQSTDPTIPTGLKVENASTSETMHYPETLSVSWNPVDNAVSYRLQRSLDNVNWSTITNTVTTDMWDWNLTPGIEYYYRIASIDRNNHVSEFSSPVSGRRLVPVDAPVVAVVSRTEKFVTIQWDAVDNAVEYHILVSKNQGQSWTWYAGTPGTSCIYQLTSPGESSLLSVVAVNNHFETGYTSSARSNLVTIPAYEQPQKIPARPNSLIALPNNSSQIEITWNTVAGAETYQLERTASLDGFWTTIYEGSDNSFSDNYSKNLETETVYYYRVSAVNDVGRSRVSYHVSALTANPTEDTKIPTGLVTESRSTAGIGLSWNAVSDAASYKIQYSTDRLNWTTNSVTSPTFAHINPARGIEYYYRVASADAQNNVSEYSYIISGRTPTVLEPPLLTLTSRTKNTVTLEWSEVENAANYNLYVSKDGGQTWNTASHYNTITSHIYNISSDPDAEYMFRVQVWESELGYARYSDYSNVVTSTVPFDMFSLVPERPGGLAAEAVSYSQIALSWNPAAGANTYQLERAESPNGSWTTVYEGSETEFVNNNLEASTFYYYRVSAVNTAGTSKSSYTVAE
ncbi:MAG: fibronectin type III domain-containing protein, partial [Planctomycetaceae bacterium]|nr:fibronectin type III domain-containing protein [Planctomycetaceae bacterium]